VNELVWLHVRDALALHRRTLSVDGGLAGVRDPGLLESAVARPLQLHSYAGRPGVIELAAAYAAGLVRNHPFIDGNKRVGFLLCVLFLEFNGYRFVASEESATAAMLGLAARTIDEKEFVAWLRTNCDQS
jgi:death on curing protein